MDAADPAPAGAAGSDWWRDAVVYQIYPRSFADSDGDGIGDLPGITSRVDHLAGLGVDAVWLSPFYPSALADGGYDVDDHRDVDPTLGTLADFDAMVAALHAAGIKVIVDIVPNHTSDAHPWFREALAAGPGSRARARYHFRDGRGPDRGLPPNDWQSGFGGPAWQRVPDGQWYFHLFAAEQPDLNWDDEQVRADFVTTLRFWADRGVDGFRVDVAHGLVKDLSQLHRTWQSLDGPLPDDGSHPLWDRDDVQDIYRQWREVFDSYQPPKMAVAEAAVPGSRRPRYADRSSLGQAFNFELQEADWSWADYRRVIESGLADVAAGGSSTTWLLGCHDTPRVATRYGLPSVPGRSAQQVARDWLLTDGRRPPVDPALGLRRARAAALVLFALPGSAYVYQGEELGLPEVGDLPREVLADPMATRSQGREKGRDGCRVPLPWSPEGPSLGFGPGSAHLPQPASFAAHAVAVQLTDPHSTLNLYRAAIRLRRELTVGGELRWAPQHEPALHFVRGEVWHCVTNFGSAPLELPPGRLLLASAPLQAGRLAPDTTAWVQAAN